MSALDKGSKTPFSFVGVMDEPDRFEGFPPEELKRLVRDLEELIDNQFDGYGEDYSLGTGGFAQDVLIEVAAEACRRAGIELDRIYEEAESIAAGGGFSEDIQPLVDKSRIVAKKPGVVSALEGVIKQEILRRVEPLRLAEVSKDREHPDFVRKVFHDAMWEVLDKQWG